MTLAIRADRRAQTALDNSLPPRFRLEITKPPNAVDAIVFRLTNTGREALMKPRLSSAIEIPSDALGTPVPTFDGDPPAVLKPGDFARFRVGIQAAATGWKTVYPDSIMVACDEWDEPREFPMPTL